MDLNINKNNMETEVCIDKERFFKMEEKLDNHIEKNNVDLFELKGMMKTNASMINGLSAQRKAEMLVVKVLFYLSGAVGFVIGIAYDYFTNHGD